MKITTEPMESRQLSLILEIDEEQTQQAMQRAARQISKQANIPGFRKGKAPYDLILQRFGEDTVRREAAELLVEEAYDQALEQENIEPLAAAMLEDIKLTPITFTFTVPLKPTVEVGDYRSHRLKPPKVKVDKKQVQEALQNLREQNAILEQVDRAVAPNDGVVVDLAGRTVEGGEEFLKGEDLHLLLEPDITYPAPGFPEAIAGMELDEERTVTLTLPDDFPREDLRGQEAEFTVKLKEVYDSILPDLDDDLARSVGNYDTIKELEKHFKEQLREAAERQVNEEYATQVLDAVVEQAQVEYPPIVLERELNAAVREYESLVKRQAKLSLEDYLRFQGQTLDGLRDELRPSVETRLKRALVLSEIAELEALEVEDKEVDTQIEAASASWGIRAEQVRASLSSDAGQQGVRSRLLGDKAIQRLVAIAKGEAPEDDGSGKEPETQESPEGGEEA